jgi:hypothetical protein
LIAEEQDLRMNRKTRFGRYVMSALLIGIAAIVTHQDVHGADQQKVRAAGVAGSFYPSDPAALTAMIDGMLANASTPAVNGPILAVVAPHAGYQYSGPVAAFTYAALKGHKYSRVVVIAPSHFEGFDFTSVYDGDAYATPLGTVSVDKAFAQQLIRQNSSGFPGAVIFPPRRVRSTRLKCNCRGCSACWATSRWCRLSWEIKATRAAVHWEWRWPN